MSKTKVLLIACQLSVWCQQHPWEHDGLFLEGEHEGGIDDGRAILELGLGAEWLRDDRSRGRVGRLQNEVSTGL